MRPVLIFAAGGAIGGCGRQSRLQFWANRKIPP